MDIFAKCYEKNLADEIREQNLYPYFRALESRQDKEVIMEGKRRIMLGSNNYLGLTTQEEIVEVDFSRDNGIDVSRDLLKIAVVERHLHTGHRGVGFIRGAGMKRGAIASSVSHDSHNLIVMGTNDADMALCGNHVLRMGGGCAVVADGQVLAELPLPIAGLMSAKPAAEVAQENRALHDAVRALCGTQGAELFMIMAFVSLPVIPALKMTTQGLVDVNRQERVSLYV